MERGGGGVCRLSDGHDRRKPPRRMKAALFVIYRLVVSEIEANRSWHRSRVLERFLTRICIYTFEINRKEMQLIILKFF